MYHGRTHTGPAILEADALSNDGVSRYLRKGRVPRAVSQHAARLSGKCGALAHPQGQTELLGPVGRLFLVSALGDYRWKSTPPEQTTAQQGIMEQREGPATCLKDNQMWGQNLENLENREEMKKRNYRGQGSGARGQG